MEAFQGFARVFPDNCVLLVDTYDTMEGLRKAIDMARQMSETRQEPPGNQDRQR